MCAVSFVGDHYQEKYTNPDWFRIVSPMINPAQPFDVSPVSKEDFDALKRDVEEMKLLLRRAKAYDESTGQPDCEMDEKVDLLRRIAKAVGVDLNDVLKPEA